MLIPQDKKHYINNKNMRENFGAFSFLRKNKNSKIGRSFITTSIKPKFKEIKKENSKINEDVIKKIILIIMIIIKL